MELPASLTTEVPVSCSLGAMGPLIRWLQSLLYTDQCLPQELSKDELQGFVEDLEAIRASAMDLSSAADTSFTDKCWMKEVREICYDTEDYLDTVLQLHSGAGVPKIFWMKKQRWRLKIPWIQAKMKQQRRSIKIPWIRRTKVKHQHRRPLIAKDMTELRSRLQSARSRRLQSAAAVKPIASLPVPLGPLLHTPYAGLGKHVKEIVSLLALNSEQQLKTVPIVGHAGAGKTALATTLYQKFGLGFHCRAFLRVSRNPDTRRLLASLLSQVKGPQPRRGMCDLQDLTASIRKHLQDKSYFIVVDDLWATSVWDIIRRAFPEGSCCSRIITTTEVEDVALACSGYHSKGIFKMVPLNDDQSRQLFFCRVCVSEDDCLDQDFKEISHGTIQKSGGLPLAIIYIASMLASWPNLVLEQKKYTEDCLRSALRPNVPSERMKEVLNLIYHNLPCHLKTCLIYLNMYPEDFVIQKDDLVRQWVAESFLSAVEGKDDEQVAGEYFDELVARGLIQPVDTSHNSQVLSCTVHHMVFDLIAYECMEENFITALDYFDIDTGISDKVRRLSIKLGGAKSAQIQGSFRMSQVRSLLFSGFFKCIPCIEEFRFLRVLILYIWSDQRKANLDLAIIRKLIQLRYLKIECNMAVKLPAKIQGLQQLMALEVGSIVATVPSDVVRLRCLLHLHLPSAAELPRGIGLLTSLRSLGHFNLSTSSRHNVLDLSKLTNVQDLHLTCSPAPSKRLMRNMECLASVLGKISKLKSLVLDGGFSSCRSISCDGLSGVSPAPVLLEMLELSPHICIISSLPRWIQELSNLQILKIPLRNLSSDDVNILKKLPVLVALSLYVRTGNPAERIVFNKEGFSVLKHFKLVSTSLCVAFTEGAMNTVRRLKLGFNADTMEQYSPLYAGFKHLTSLEVFSAKIGCAGNDEASRNAIESSLQLAFTEHPSPPIINIQLVDSIFHGDVETTSVAQRRKHHPTEKGSTEVPNKQTLSRMDMTSECSTDMQHSESSSHRTKQDTLDQLLNQGDGNEIKPEEEYYHSTKEYDLVVNEDYNEEHEIQEIGSREDSSIQTDSRTSMASESSLGMQNPDMEMGTQHEEHLQSGQTNDLMVKEEPKAPYEFDEKNLEENTKKRSYGRVPTAQEFSAPKNAGHKEVGPKPATILEDAMVSASTGAMNSLLTKLTTLMSEPYAKHKGTGKQELILIDGLQAINCLLKQLPNVTELNMPMKNYMKQIREMTYALEDFVDDLMIQFVSKNDISFSIRRVIGYPQKNAVLQKFINQIQKLRTQLEADLGSIMDKTKMVAAFGPSYMVTTEPQLSTVRDEESGIVGMDGPQDELVKWLIGVKQDQLQVVCIFGLAGIGKTTLATQVYNKIKWQFDCRVFIPVSKKTCVTRLLQNILSQLRWDPEIYDCHNNEDIINEIQRDLQDKRYIIVIDGAWSTEIWQDMKHVLPENNLGSRIITTTRCSNVAKSCGKHSSSFIYRMEPLSFQNSLSLFQSIVFGSKERRPTALEEITEKIVRECCGIPLAISVIAGVLARKPAETEQWIKFQEWMKQAGTGHFHEEWMRKIFYISYSDLYSDMKTCLLYFSAFPENKVIGKDDLIRRWVAEGFLPRRSEESWWETGEAYFLELIAKKLIEPVYHEEDDEVPICCKVQSLIHNFITSLSIEENFVKSDTADLSSMQYDVVRRLSLNYGNNNQEGNDNSIYIQTLQQRRLDFHRGKRNIDPCKVWSFKFSGFAKWIPDLSAFKHVRVLDLENTKGLNNQQLECIGGLSLLRYLGLGGTGVPGLPEKIMALKHLITLDLTRTRVRELPAFEETKLVSLLASGLKIQRSIEDMQELEELSTVYFDHNCSCADNAARLVTKLRRLRMLGVTFGHMYGATETDCKRLKHFLEELGRSSLQYLFLYGYPRHLLDLLLDYWPCQRPCHLQKFNLRIHGSLSEIPQKMAYIIALTHLNIRVKAVGGSVHTLKKLPNLVFLDLISEEGTRGRWTINIDGFRCLKVFWFWCLHGGMGLQFKAGAMPQLRMLRLGMEAWETKHRYGDFDFGIQHLSCLVQVRATISCRFARALDVKAAEAAIRDQVSQIPKNPILELINVFRDKMVKDEEHNDSQGAVWIRG